MKLFIKNYRKILNFTLNVFLLQCCSQNVSSLYDQNIWEENTQIEKPRDNPYKLSPQEFDRYRQRGIQHALFYPVDTTGIVIPDKPFRTLLNGSSNWPQHLIATQAVRLYSGFQSFTHFQDWMGLNRFADDNDQRMGETRMFRDGVNGLTYSCAMCHSSNLFGKRVIGMTNRFPRANATFGLVKSSFSKFPVSALASATVVSDDEMALMHKFSKALDFVRQKEPVHVGLDTSLAQVSLSLSVRNDDGYATKIEGIPPRANLLENHVADSKPSVWWNLKYKTRWLSDGSVVSGNPVFTNFLWNEIGRSSDLEELEGWLDSNGQIVEELTTAVFSMQAPRYTDFFDAPALGAVKKGEVIFNKNCSGCHGQYVKDWQAGSVEEKLANKEVIYHKKTPVINVGTDPNRYLGMINLSVQLNNLSISQRFGIRVEPQIGYVPPPLVGIWARWPYFHNNSVPSLCAVLSVNRPKQYWARPALNKQTDYDQECGGYPNKKGDEEYFFDTLKPGMSAVGHSQGILIRDGIEVLSPLDKKHLISYLKTL